MGKKDRRKAEQQKESTKSAWHRYGFWVLGIVLAIAIVVIGILASQGNGNRSISSASPIPSLSEIPRGTELPPSSLLPEVPRISVEEVPVEVIKEISVEVVKEVPIKLRYFKDTDELEKFLEESDADHHIYIKANKSGIIDFSKYDCEDYAIALRNHAHAKGFHMSIQVVWHYRRPDTGELITRYYEGHVLNSIIIGNEMYFIESQTDEYWLVSYLD